MPSAPQPLYIDNNSQLQDYCRQISQTPWLALDTEFVRERTYFPQLCLIQTASAKGDIACIDTLAIHDLSPLFELLADSAVTTILHAVSQDLEVLYLNGAQTIGQLFDTQLAAGLLGLGDQIGYAGLVKQVLDVDLAKGHARTDWSRRPLSAEQLAYAADDVRYLGALYEHLNAALTQADRGQWLEEDMEAMRQPENYQPDPAKSWRRLKGIGKLDAPAQHRAAGLAEWRERRALERNLPRRWVLADAPLLELANRAPATQAELSAMTELPAKLIEKQGETLLELMRRPVSSDKPLVKDWTRPEPHEKALQKKLKTQVRETAETLGLNPSLLATRSDIEALAAGQRDTSVLRGWRAQVIGEALLATAEAAS